MRTLAALSLVVLLACSGRPSSGGAAPVASTPAAELPPPPPAPPPSGEGATPPAPDAAAPVAAPAPPPVERSGKVWPFHAWDRAEAVTFNQFGIREDVQLNAYDEHGWSPHLVDRKALDAAHAKKAVDLVTQTEGEVTVSKCPFPRHAVVLYDGEVPVASINVCFSCGDIVLWPSWSPRPDWENITKKQLAELERRSKKQAALYEKAFPRWKAFFRDEVGFAIDGKYDGH
ncbi:MAG: hypothetical protein KF764_08080 [Labilithrix sp.]|nr:hypothetical protein [Labilithrix sp.]MBX3223445.1 hypothetical protein [Labilithrix sp.]